MLLWATAASAGFLGGVAYVPPGIGMLAFDDADAWSGTLASEWDGWLRPALTARGGWVGEHTAILGSFAVVQIAADSYAENEHHYSVGGVRLGAEWRRYLFAREAGTVNVWPTAGIFGILPNASESDSGWTVEESDAAEEDSRDRRARIGGLGAQAGLGADYLWGDKAGRPAVALGIQWTVRGFGGLDVAEATTDFSLLIVSEAALTLEFTR